MTIATSGHSFAFTCVCVGGWIHMCDWACVHTCASCRVAVLVYGWMCVFVSVCPHGFVGPRVGARANYAACRCGGFCMGSHNIV